MQALAPAGRPFDAFPCKRLAEVVPADTQGRQHVLAELLGATSRRHPPWFESPFYCNYGFNLSGGRRARAGPRSARRPLCWQAGQLAGRRDSSAPACTAPRRSLRVRPGLCGLGGALLAPD